MNDDDELLTTAEAGAALKLSPKTIRTWIRDQRLPAMRLGRQLRVRKGDVLGLMKAGVGQLRAARDKAEAKRIVQAQVAATRWGRKLA